MSSVPLRDSQTDRRSSTSKLVKFLNGSADGLTSRKVHLEGNWRKILRRRIVEVIRSLPMQIQWKELNWRNSVYSDFIWYWSAKCWPTVSLPHLAERHFLFSESAIHYVLFFQLMPLDGMLDDPATKAASEPSPPSFPMQMRRTRITTSAAKSSLSILSRCNPLDKSRENACHIMSHHFDIQ